MAPVPDFAELEAAHPQPEEIARLWVLADRATTPDRLAIILCGIGHALGIIHQMDERAFCRIMLEEFKRRYR